MGHKEMAQKPMGDIEADILRRAPAIAELQQLTQRYGMTLTNDAASQVIDRALERGKTDAGVRRSVRNQLFKMLTRTNPMKAIELDIEYHEKKGIKLDEEKKNDAIMKTGRIFESEQEARQAYMSASRMLKKDAAVQLARRQRPQEEAQEEAVATGRRSQNNAYLAQEGKKRWETLGMENATIKVGGKETTVGQALNGCSELQGEARAERFREIASAIAEKFRVGSNGTNSFGIRFDLLSSDPAKMDTQKKFNCFSGSMALGQMLTYAAGRAGMQEEVNATAYSVSSFTMGREWDDRGHVILKLDIAGTRPAFFDSTNATLPNQGNSLAARGNTLRSTGLSRANYNLGVPMAITPGLVGVARYQDSILNKSELDAKDVARIPTMPPLFVSYYVTHLTPEQKTNFFKSFGPEQVIKIRNPGLRYQVATMATATYINTEPARAFAFGKIALNAMAQTGGRNLPAGSLLSSTISMATFMDKHSQEGQALVENSRIWAYIPHVVTTSARELDSPTAKNARDFLTGFYNRRGNILDAEASSQPQVLLTYCQAIRKLDEIAKGANDASRRTVDGLYESLGINRTRLMSALRENARQIDPGFGSGAMNDIRLENSFLTTAVAMTRPGFSLDTMKILARNLKGENAVLAQSVVMTLENKSTLGSIMYASGPLRAAAKKSGLA